MHRRVFRQFIVQGRPQPLALLHPNDRRSIAIAQHRRQLRGRRQKLLRPQLRCQSDVDDIGAFRRQRRRGKTRRSTEGAPYGPNGGKTGAAGQYQAGGAKSEQLAPREFG